MKFLVADDSPTMLRIIANTLERIGYTDIVEANDGAEALAKFDSTVGFIITDWNMPKMNGRARGHHSRRRSGRPQLHSQAVHSAVAREKIDWMLSVLPA